jgi:hypothetical protein
MFADCGLPCSIPLRVEKSPLNILLPIKDMCVRNVVIRAIFSPKKPNWVNLADFRDRKVLGGAKVCPGFQQGRRKVA